MIAHSFDGIIGQDSTVALLKQRLVSHNHSPLMLAGPAGSGKLTIVRHYARAIFCEAQTKPCGQCSGCQCVVESGSLQYAELQADQYNKHKHVRDLIRKMRSAILDPIFIVVRESEHLSGPVSDRMLKALEGAEKVSADYQEQEILLEDERLQKEGLFVFLTADVMSVSPTIRSRCIVRELVPAAFETVLSDLVSICVARRIGYEERALRIIAASADGWIGRGRANLERVANAGSVTYTQVLSVLGMAQGEAMAECWLALFEGRTDDAYQHSLKLGDDYERRASAMLTFLRSFYFRNVVRDVDANLAPVILTEGIGADTWKAMEAAWTGLVAPQPRSLADGIRQAMRFWSEVGGSGFWKPVFNEFAQDLHGTTSATD